ncbi:MAG: nicotinamide riboside transporter PnuC [Opitutales bacterium]
MLDQLLTQLAATSWVEWLGMTAGILGVWLSIKEKIAAWPLFITCYGCYVYISYQFGLFAFMGMNIVFIAISLYGLWKWSHNRSSGKDALPITSTRKRHWAIIFTFLLLGTIGIGGLLDSRGSSNWPYWDALATCCGFVAQWMLSRKHIETWIFWILSDLIYLAIFFQEPSWPSVILFTTFIFLALKGWFDWRPLVRTQNPPT